MGEGGGQLSLASHLLKGKEDTPGAPRWGPSAVRTTSSPPPPPHNAKMPTLFCCHLNQFGGNSAGNCLPIYNAAQ